MTEPLSGAEFARQVGADPEKWAARFLAAYTETCGPLGFRRVEMPIADFCEAKGHTDADRLAFVTAWFRDAMEAAVKAAEPPSVDWDKLRDRLNVTLTEHGLPNLRKRSE